MCFVCLPLLEQKEENREPFTAHRVLGVFTLHPTFEARLPLTLQVLCSYYSICAGVNDKRLFSWGEDAK